MADDLNTDAAPGTIIAAERDDLFISCGDNTVLKIDEIQPEGKRRMGVRDFLNGSNVRVAAVLGAGV